MTLEAASNENIELGLIAQQVIIIEDNEELCVDGSLTVAETDLLGLHFVQGQANFYLGSDTSADSIPINDADIECVLALPSAETNLYRVVANETQVGVIESRQVAEQVIIRDISILPANLRSEPVTGPDTLIRQVSSSDVRGFVCASNSNVDWLKIAVGNPDNPDQFDVGWIFNTRITRRDWEALKTIVNSGEIEAVGGAPICE